jgi:hypothetical protein
MKDKIGFFIRSNNETTVETFLNGQISTTYYYWPSLSKKEERQVRKIVRKYLNH